MTERRHPLSEEEIQHLAKCIMEKMTCTKGCPLSDEDLSSVKSMISIKKGSVKLAIYVGAALLLLALKDIYEFVVYILKHIKVVQS